MTHRFALRVYYEDTDLAGIVYYANYLKFIERGRSEWVRALGVDQRALKAERDLVFAVRRVEADYLRPALFGDDLWVETRLLQITGARIVVEQTVLRADGPAPGEGVLSEVAAGEVAAGEMAAGDVVVGNVAAGDVPPGEVAAALIPAAVPGNTRPGHMAPAGQATGGAAGSRLFQAVVTLVCLSGAGTATRIPADIRNALTG